MRKTIIALGGGTFGEPRETYGKWSQLPKSQTHYPTDTTAVDKLILNSTRKSHPKLLLILTATEDGQHDLRLYEEYFRKQFGGLGAKVDALYLITQKPSAAEIESKIQNADAIYVSGGNSSRMMKTWRKLGVDKLLRQAYDKGTVMSGLSAGSICWFKYGNSNSFYTNKPFRVTAMGWIKALACPHYDSESFRQKSLKNMLKRTPKLIGLAIDEHAAVELVDGKYRTHSFGSGGNVQKCYWHNGEYYMEEVSHTEKFHDLSELLSVPKTSY